MNWFTSSGFLKAAVESATNLTKSLIQEEYVDDSDADDSPAVPRLKPQSTSPITEEEESVGITPQLIDFVNNVLLYPKTFTDFPLDNQIKDQIILAEWQEKHARFIIQRVPELDAVRFKLCPTKMPDNAFWHIYFILVRTKLSNKLEQNTIRKPPPTDNQNADESKLKKSSNPTTPTAKIPTSLLLPLSPILDLINTNENAEAPSSAQPELSPRTQELEEYFENLWKDDLNSSLEALEQHPNYIDPEKDNYFVLDISFEDFVKGKVTSYPPSPKKLSPRPKNEKSIPSKAAKVIRSLTSSLIDDSNEASLPPTSPRQSTSAPELTRSSSGTLKQDDVQPVNATETTTPITSQTEQTTPQEASIEEMSFTTEENVNQQETATPQIEYQEPIEPSQKEQTTPEETSFEEHSSTAQDSFSTGGNIDSSQATVTSTPTTNESLQDVISSLMQDDVPSNSSAL
mmetsp:Transcript_15210/g.21233  ORF Transcript_15210/g.21233 Transcript_15210/m.21233 type:complete len:458 (+) Transcript_15210:15-1388(+)